MTSVAFACVTWAALGCAHQPASVGQLDQPAFAMDECRREPTRPYVPQPGDIIVVTDRRIISLIGHYIAGGGPPNHTMLVVARPDGRLAVLEAGPYGEVSRGVTWIDIDEHLARYDGMGRIWVRQRHVPLTPEQSASLTAYAHKQEGKPFARIRTGIQITPFRARGPFFTEWRGDPDYEQVSYYCGELAMNGLVYGGLLDPKTTKPGIVYPRDMFFGGRSNNDAVNRTIAPINCGWEPPARWTSCGCPPQ